jgi:hypothetical protein
MNTKINTKRTFGLICILGVSLGASWLALGDQLDECIADCNDQYQTCLKCAVDYNGRQLCRDFLGICVKDCKTGRR